MASAAYAEHDGRNRHEPPKYGDTSTWYPRMHRSARRICGRTLSRLAESAFESGAVIGFKGSQRGLEQLASRHDHDVEACRKFGAPENLSYQAFSSVSLDGAAQFFRRRDPQPAGRLVVGQDEQRAVAAANAGAALVDLLKFGVTADSLFAPKASIVGRLGAQSYSLLTVRRFRPLARRRLSTRRPFFVLMRTRNPCVRLRCLVFGWNVRLPFMVLADS